ncbi:MAG: hypothetical protein AAF657_19370 [Acidobacteriota bacterium]
MDCIADAVVEETWEEVARFPPQRAEREMQRVAKRQRHLLTFVDAYSEDLSREAAELAFYMFFTIYRMFQRAYGVKVARVHSDKIEAGLDQNENLLGRLEGAHVKFIERVAQVESSRQPHVMRYLVETLIEAPEGEDPVDLTEEETGILFLILKTVIDVLDRAVKA